MNKRVVTTQTETYQAVADRLTTAWPAGTPEAKKGARIARRILWVCRQANWVPETTVASHQAVTKFFDTHTPATFGVTPGTYAVYRSEVLSVLKPQPVRKGRYILQMTGVYREVHDRTVDSGMPEAFRWRCSPLLWYLHDHGIAPPDISVDTLMEYYQFSLDVEQLAEERARRRAQDAAKYISLMASDPDFGEFGFCPVEITFPNRSIKYNVPRDIADALLKEYDNRVVLWARGEVSNKGETWAEYIARLDAAETPASTSDKKRAWKARQAYQDTMAKGEQVSRAPAKGFMPESRRWKPATVRSRRDHCATCAKVMYEAGQFHIETVEELTDPEIVEAIAKRLDARKPKDNPQSSYTSGILSFISTLAKDFVQRPPDDLEKIGKVKTKYGKKHEGIAFKNKEILRKFTDARIQALIDMPDRITAHLNREVVRRREAYRQEHGVLPPPVAVFDQSLIKQVMLALAAHIMLTRAPRRSNLAGLRLEWLRWRDGCATLEVPAPFVKSRKVQDPPLIIPLDVKVSKLLDQYLKSLRPKMLHPDDAQNPFLFPSPPHAGKQRFGGFYVGLPDRLVDQVHERVGVRIHPHLWRHLLGWIWLKEDPDKLPAVQKLLGHKSIETTIKYYADIDESVVLKKWLEYLDGKKT
ncbi:site-specific integrase [Roseibaca sp. V10]|uniref:Site-specific integrase n=1 Tax=Roseinatronobacter domitianus TaxID=2940293 RepID=A0ABT0M3P1_9RHOB|nr:site-specific integrase [Roseibaca domitiana]MCL1629476.1 site-specific integrase [Roseibaca domitiana]